MKKDNLIGQKFNNLLIIGISPKKVKTGQIWICKCDCGNITEGFGSNIKNGHKKSCGCLKKQSYQRIKDPKEAVLLNKYKSYKKSAKNRDLIFNINFDQFIELTSKNCFYCQNKGDISGDPHYRRYGIILNGLDRTNSEIGYEIDNIVPCCSICNKMKNSLGLNKFLNQIKAIYDNLIVSRS